MSIGVIVQVPLTVGPGFCFLIVDLGDWNTLMILYHFRVMIYLVIFRKFYTVSLGNSYSHNLLHLRDIINLLTFLYLIYQMIHPLARSPGTRSFPFFNTQLRFYNGHGIVLSLKASRLLLTALSLALNI